MDKSKLSKFGKSAKGNFYPIDSIGVPHPYCITPRHIGHASDSFSGMLSKDAIESAEKHGAHCGVRGCNLKFSEHEQALLIECKSDLKLNGKVNSELHEYLLSINELATKEGFAGYAFVEAK